MIKNLLQLFFVLMVAVSAVYAQNTTEGNEPKVIDTLSDTYKNNFTIESPPASLSSSSKVKYISGFTENSSEPSSPETQYNDTTNSQDKKREPTAEELKENYKILKSN
jgi:hypothetical protein